eukprot:6175347-Pleurochrysis_carterae.AAC.3
MGTSACGKKRITSYNRACEGPPSTRRIQLRRPLRLLQVARAASNSSPLVMVRKALLFSSSRTARSKRVNSPKAGVGGGGIGGWALVATRNGCRQARSQKTSVSLS